MATVIITNTVLQPAQEGQGVLVTAAENTNFNLLAVGQVCELDSNGKKGTITWVNTFSNQFKIVPIYPYTDLSSDGYNNVLSGEDIIVTY